MTDNISSLITKPKNNGDTISKSELNNGGSYHQAEFDDKMVTEEALTRWGELNIHCYIKIFIIAVLFYWLFHNEISRIVNQWADPSWSHGFLIPAFSLYFLNQHKKEILTLQTRPNYLGLFLMIFGIVFYPLNIVNPAGYGYFRPLGMIATLGAIVLFLGGWKLIKYSWLPIAYLVFAVPLPQRLYVAFTMPMQKLAAFVASLLLDIVKGMEATANGVVIDVFFNGQHMEPSLNVAEACSGMRLLMAFLALGVAMAYLHYRPIWQRLVLLSSTIPIAVLCNIVRVTVTGFIYILWEPRYAQGLYHDLLGMLMLPLAFGLYGFLAWFMSRLFLDERELVEDIVVRRN